MKISRKWAMPNAETFSIEPIRDFVFRYLKEGMISADPFARNSHLATYTNDLNPNTAADFHMDAEDFLKQIPAVDLILFDPPYSPRQISEMYQSIGLKVSTKETQNAKLYKRVRDAAKVKQEGIVLSFGWNSAGMGRNRGYKIEEILIVAHGGAHNDTICVAERLTVNDICNTNVNVSVCNLDKSGEIMGKFIVSREFDTAEEAIAFLEGEELPPSREQVEGQIAAARPPRQRRTRSVAPAPVEPIPQAPTAAQIASAPPAGSASFTPSAAPGPQFSAGQPAPQGAPQIPNFADAFAAPFGGAPNPNGPAPASAPAVNQDPNPTIGEARAIIHQIAQKNNTTLQRVVEWALPGLNMAPIAAEAFLGNGPGEGVITTVPVDKLTALIETGKKSI